MSAVVLVKDELDRVAATARARLNYSPETGILTWACDVHCGRGRVLARAGQEAGTRRASGYRLVNLLNKPRLSHRLAWLLHFGDWPSVHIDHMNGDPSDNRIANLRDVSAAMNLQNLKGPMAGKKHGSLIGSAWHEQTGKWRAVIRIGGKQKSLGYFVTEIEAHEAYVKAKRLHHPGGLL